MGIPYGIVLEKEVLPMKAIMHGKDFNRLMAATKRFVSKQPGKKLIDWIRIEFCKENLVKAIASDGFKLSVEFSIATSIDGNFICYVRPNIAKMKSRYIEVELVGSKLLITSDDNIIGFNQPEGEYIDYQQSIDNVNETKPKYSIAFNTVYLIETLKSVQATQPGRKICLLEFRGEHEPALIKTDNENVKLVLPVRKGLTNA